MHTLARKLALVLFLLGPAAANAAILRAGSSCTYATPQLAFAAANNNDTVRVRSGNYLGPFVIGRAIRVEGGYDDCSTTARSGRSDFHGPAAQSPESLLRIPAFGGPVVLDRITLRDNKKSVGDGAGLHLTSATVSLKDVEIRNNRAYAGNGGGIYLDNATVELVEDSSVLIEGNQADAGGGIAANGNQARILFDLGAVGAAAVLRNNRVNTNSGSGVGSAIYLYNGGDALLIDTLIEVANGEPYGAGSAIRIANSIWPSGLSLRNSHLLSHIAVTSSGYGAIVATQAVNVVINISDSVIDGWHAGLILQDGSARLDRVTFSNQDGGIYGGGVFLSGSAHLEGHSLQFIDNTARDGGAIAALDSASWALFGAPGLPTRFVGNWATDAWGSGGAIYHNSTGSGSINDSPTEWGLVEFINNRAAGLTGISNGSGGAIYFDSVPAAQLTLRSPLLFSGNHAALDGGAVHLNRGHLSLDARVGEQIEFSDNTVGRDGGAIYRASGNQLLINQGAGNHGTVLFSANTANTGRGGAIAAIGAGELRIQAPAQFSNPGLQSTADYGGHLYAAASAGQSSIVDLQGWDGVGRGISIAGGLAEFEGGGAYLSGVSGTLDWVQFGTPTQPNRVFVRGGANLVAIGAGTQITLRNSSLRYGRQFTSGGNGHGLLVRTGASVVMESIFGIAGTTPAPGQAWPCQAATLAHERHCSEIADNGDINTLGGGLYVESNAQLTLRGVSIDRNLGNPGALQIESGGNVIARNVRISQNGGGIKLDAGAQMDAEHLTLAANTGIALELANSAGTSMSLARSIVWSNSSGIVKGAQATLNFDCNISQTAPFGLNANPVLVDSARGLHRLGAGSAAIDLCLTSGQTSDLDGRARPAGNSFDAGAFEATASLPDAMFANGFE